MARRAILLHFFRGIKFAMRDVLTLAHLRHGAVPDGFLRVAAPAAGPVPGAFLVTLNTEHQQKREKKKKKCRG